jgi:transcriptional regulator with XRE-family HTH domain
MIDQTARGMDFSVVRNLRKKRGLSTEELAQQSGLTRSTVVKIEAGEGNPTIFTIEALARVFQLTASELVRLAEGVKIESAQTEDFTREDYGGRRIAFRNLEIYCLDAPRGVHMESEVSLHEDVAEVCIVLSGRVVLSVGGERLEMGPGNAVRFNALHEHRFDVLEDSEVLLIHHPLV